MLLTFAITVWVGAVFVMVNLGQDPILSPDLFHYSVAALWTLWAFGLCFGAGHHAGLSQGRAEKKAQD
jgi:hypothetical protein